MSVTGSDRESLTLAIADLKAIDARLTVLAAADPPIESDGSNLSAAIRESRTLVQTAIALLAGGRIASGALGGGVGEATDQAVGGTKRRVKIKAESETTATNSAARTLTAARSDAAASKASGKAGTRGAERARGPTAAASATATAKTTPSSSLLARLGAATPEPAARDSFTGDGKRAAPTPASAPKSDSLTAFDTANRLARLEAEIDGLTKSSNTADAQRQAAPPDEPAVAAATKTAAVLARSSTATSSTPEPEHRPRASNPDTGDEDDDAEIVIVSSETKAAGSAGKGTLSARQSPRAFRDPPPGDDDDAEVEIVQPGASPGMGYDAAGRGAGERDPGAAKKPDSARAAADAAKPAAPAKWRLFRGPR